MILEIKDFLLLLQPHEKIVVILCHEGYSLKEVAEITGYHEKSVVRMFSEIKEKWRQYEISGVLCVEED